MGYRLFISHTAPDAEVVAGTCVTLQEAGVVPYVSEPIPPRASAGGARRPLTSVAGFVGDTF